MKHKMYVTVGEKYYTPLQIPGDYYPNMDHVELIEAQLTKEGMLAYESLAEGVNCCVSGDDSLQKKDILRHSNVEV